MIDIRTSSRDIDRYILLLLSQNKSLKIMPRENMAQKHWFKSFQTKNSQIEEHI